MRTMRRFLILFLILTPIVTKAQSNCSSGSWSYAGDLKAGPQCPTNPLNGYVINLTETVTVNEWCTASGIGTYWTQSPPSQDTGNGERYCPIFGTGNVDCWPRMWMYEVDGGQYYPPPSYQQSDVYYNRFFNQNYDHKVDVTNSTCYEVPPPGKMSGQDFHQCSTVLCGGGGGGCVTDEPDNDRPTSSLHRPRLMFVQDADDTGCVSPILIDVSGQGFSLTSAQGGVLFDMTATGNRYQMSWTAPGAQNGFLCLPDANGNCNTGKQLFTNFTSQPLLQSKTGKLAANGFNALSVYDQPANGGNGNGEIDSGDAIFSSLRVWIDANHDGLTQPNELFTLGQLGIRSISLNYQWDKKVDQYGNVFRYHSSVNRTTGPGRTAYDVFFVWIPGTTTTAQVCPARQLLPTEKATLR